MRVLGIDPGTATTGYGVVEDDGGRLTPIAFGVVTTPASLPMPARLVLLHEQLGELIALHKPETAGVESLFFQKNVRTAISVGQARGVILLTLERGRVPVSEYTPLEVKLAVAGYGAAEKRQVQVMVRTLLALAEIPQPDDAADALAIAICHLHSYPLKKLAEGR
jgi:crossover junction endodeoxyribonuclease RuvC